MMTTSRANETPATSQQTLRLAWQRAAAHRDSLARVIATDVIAGRAFEPSLATAYQQADATEQETARAYFGDDIVDGTDA